MVTFLAFIPFFAFRELEEVLGKGNLRGLFFLGRSQAQPGWDDRVNLSST